MQQKIYDFLPLGAGFWTFLGLTGLMQCENIHARKGSGNKRHLGFSTDDEIR